MIMKMIIIMKMINHMMMIHQVVVQVYPNLRYCHCYCRQLGQLYDDDDDDPYDYDQPHDDHLAPVHGFELYSGSSHGQHFVSVELLFMDGMSCHDLCYGDFCSMEHLFGNGNCHDSTND